MQLSTYVPHFPFYPERYGLRFVLLPTVGCLKINEDKSHERGPHTDAGSCPNPDASLKPCTRVKFQSKKGCHTSSKVDVSVLNTTIALLPKAQAW